MKLNHRKLIRRTWRTTIRRLNRSCIRVRWRAPDDLGRSITAFRRALRAHRRLARLAPYFFDEAVVRREAHNDAERRRRTAILEPILARVYGVEPGIPAATHELPPLPSLRTQHAVEQQLAAVQFWMEIGQLAMDRHQQRHPHAVPNFNQVMRLIELAIAHKKRVLGLDSPNPLPDRRNYY